MGAPLCSLAKSFCAQPGSRRRARPKANARDPNGIMSRPRQESRRSDGLRLGRGGLSICRSGGWLRLALAAAAPPANNTRDMFQI